MTRQRISGWGRTAWTTADVVSAGDSSDLTEIVAVDHRRGAIARGLGRAYGAAAQNAGGTARMMVAMHRFALMMSPASLPHPRVSASTCCYESASQRDGSSR